MACLMIVGGKVDGLHAALAVLALLACVALFFSGRPQSADRRGRGDDHGGPGCRAVSAPLSPPDAAV